MPKAIEKYLYLPSETIKKFNMAIKEFSDIHPSKLPIHEDWTESALIWRGEVKGFISDITVSKYCYTPDFDQSVNKYLIEYKVNLIKDPPFFLNIQEEGLAIKVGKVLHLLDEIEIGDKELDDKYLIRSNHEEKATELLSQKDIKETLKKIGEFQYLLIDDDECTLWTPISIDTEIDPKQIEYVIFALADITSNIYESDT